MSNYNIKEHTCAICKENFGGRKKKYCSKDCADEARRIQNRERWRQNNKPRPDVTIECEWCGKEHTVPARTAHQARFCRDGCKDAWWSREVYGHRPQAEWETIREKQKIRRQKELEKDKAIRTLKRSLSIVVKYKNEQTRIKELTRDCAECGDTFYNPSPNVLACSAECSRKRNRRISRAIYRGRINKDNLVDKNISLTKLYKRDEGTCYLCSEQCDWDDKVVTEEGHTIVGENYPSTDHIIPLSKGGMHSWDNVKLACMRCNTLKRDKVVGVENKG